MDDTQVMAEGIRFTWSDGTLTLDLAEMNASGLYNGAMGPATTGLIVCSSLVTMAKLIAPIKVRRVVVTGGEW